MAEKKGKKKEKVVYIDDGRTLADMSNVGGPRLSGSSLKPSTRFKDAWATYWNAVKMMFLPMLATMGAICIIFAILYLVFGVLG